VIYIKDEKGKLKTLKAIAIENNVPLKLIQGRYNSSKIKTVEGLIKEKHWIWKEENQ
jgi:hypothetical protein